MADVVPKIKYTLAIMVFPILVYLEVSVPLPTVKFVNVGTNVCHAKLSPKKE